MKETQIKTRYTCTLIRMDKVRNADNGKHRQECRATGTLTHR